MSRWFRSLGKHLSLEAFISYEMKCLEMYWGQMQPENKTPQYVDNTCMYT